MGPNEETPKCCGDNAPLLRKPVPALRDVCDPRSARKALGLSLAEMGRALGYHHRSHKGPYHRTAVSHFEQGDYPVTYDTRVAYHLALQRAFRLAVRNDRCVLRADSLGPRVWRFAPIGWCAKKGCLKLFRMRSARDKHCRYHRGQ